MKVLLLVLGLLGSAWWVIGPDLGGATWAGGEAQVSYYGNGQRRSEVSYRDGRPHGPAEEWFPDGRLAARGRYAGGQRDGEWSFWHADGSLDLERSGQYVDGRRIGPSQDSADS